MCSGFRRQNYDRIRKGSLIHENPFYNSYQQAASAWGSRHAAGVINEAVKVAVLKIADLVQEASAAMS